MFLGLHSNCSGINIYIYLRIDVNRLKFHCNLYAMGNEVSGVSLYYLVKWNSLTGYESIVWKIQAMSVYENIV